MDWGRKYYQLYTTKVYFSKFNLLLARTDKSIEFGEKRADGGTKGGGLSIIGFMRLEGKDSKNYDSTLILFVKF